MTDHDETLRALIAKWRVESARLHREAYGDAPARGFARCHTPDGWRLLKCADELEAEIGVQGCDSLYNGNIVMCQLPKGHEGNHQGRYFDDSGDVEWPNLSPVDRPRGHEQEHLGTCSRCDDGRRPCECGNPMTRGHEREQYAEQSGTAASNEIPRYQPVIQEWACRLPLRMQSTMLLAMRGPDGCSKHNTAKVLLRQLRSAVMVPAFPGQPDSFMGDQRGYCEWADADAFLDDHDEFPHHWLMHFIHASEIAGQFHPDDMTRAFWWRLYLALCEAFHMQNENIDELSNRLADPILSPAAREAGSTALTPTVSDGETQEIHGLPGPSTAQETRVDPTMTFQKFSEVNRRRCESAQGFNHQLGSWSTSDWMTAVVGEVGEAANVIKKLNRYRDGVPGNKQSEATLRANLRSELGDVFVYLDLLCQSLGFNIADAAVDVFDTKSLEIGYQETCADTGGRITSPALPPSLQAEIDLFREDPAAWQAEWQRKHDFKVKLLERVRELETASRSAAPQVEQEIETLRQQKRELLDMIEEGLTGWCSQTFDRVLLALKEDGRDVSDAEYSPSPDEPHLSTPVVSIEALHASVAESEALTPGAPQEPETKR